MLDLDLISIASLGPRASTKVESHETFRESLKVGAYNNRNGPECTEMDRNGPEWASITGMDIKINLFYAITFIILP